MTNKRCFKCRKVKPLSDYYKHPQMGDGHLNKCKQCTKKDATKHRSENLDYITRYDRERAKLPHRVKSRKDYFKKNPDVQRAIKERWVANNQHKRKAQYAVNNAVRDKRLIRLACQKCGDKNSNAHHEDYSKPLDVVWLCDKHHAERHKELRGTSDKEPFQLKRGPNNPSQWADKP